MAIQGFGWRNDIVAAPPGNAVHSVQWRFEVSLKDSAPPTLDPFVVREIGVYEQMAGG
jgi:hypothetical protein